MIDIKLSKTQLTKVIHVTVWLNGLVFVYKLSDCEFKSLCSHLRSQSTLSNKIEVCLKKMTVLLYTYFLNIILHALRQTFFNIYNLSFLHSPNIGKIRVKVGPKTNYFSYFMSSCTNRIAVFNIFFSLIRSQPRDKQNHPHDFFPFKYFLNNQFLTVFMQNMLSWLLELLPQKMNHGFVRQFVRNCVQSWSFVPFLYWSSSSVHHPETIP